MEKEEAQQGVELLLSGGAPSREYLYREGGKLLGFTGYQWCDIFSTIEAPYESHFWRNHGTGIGR